jgi:MurNAc alpha-1-phosphate uridylyltransferase
MIETAMIMAAGRGERMRPITDTLPKPLVMVGGRTMLDRAIDGLEAAGVRRIVVNTQYRAGQIRDHLAQRGWHKTDLVVIDEGDEALETGGGVVNALPHLGKKPFFVVNADTIWIDGSTPMLSRLTDHWRDEWQGLLLLHPTDAAKGDAAMRDFYLDDLFCPRRPVPDHVPALTYAGVQIVSPRLFDNPPSRRFSTNILWDRAAAINSLGGMVHDGAWYHIGTPQGLARAEADFLHNPLLKTGLSNG